MKKPLQFTNVGNDLQGNPIVEINGEHYFYVDDDERGENTGADHIWRAKSGNQLALLGPDYDYAELTTPMVI
jgi:hypothetical protein